MVKYEGIILILFLALPFVSGEMQEGPFNPVIKSVELELFLNIDGSVDSTITLKSLIPIKLDSENYTILSSMIISDDELIDQKSIKIIDLHNPSITFTPTAYLNPETCLNKYHFNESNNDINFCVSSTKENDMYYTIKYKYESVDYPELEACSAIGVVRRQLTFNFKRQENPHYAGASFSVDDDLLFNGSQDCPEGWEKSPLPNEGFKCINKNLLSPEDKAGYTLNITLRGVKKAYIVEKQEQSNIDEQKAINRKLNIKNAIDKILIIIIGIIGFVPSISKRVKTWLANSWKKNKLNKWVIVLLIIIFLFVYYKLQVW